MTPRLRRVSGLPKALAVIAISFVSGFAPAQVRFVSQWAAEKRFVAAESGSPFPGKWSNELFPPLVEVMDCLSLCHPASEIVFMKPHQIGGSECGLNLIGQVIDETPAPMMVVLPTTDEAKAYVKLKLQPTIDETPALRSKIREQKSRDEDGSTTNLKKFRGGFLQIVGANSSRGLKMRTVRVIIFEEVSEYPQDVDNQGDPVALGEKRTSFWKGREKKAYISTPDVKGTCRISAKYEASDQRRYYVKCPSCGHAQILVWARLRWEKDKPETAFYECAGHGCVIEHHAKAAMIAAGRWVAARPDEGRQPGFHINSLYSPTLAWSDLVKEWIQAQGKPAKLKDFVKQNLAEPWEERGEAPDHEKLFERREAYRQRIIPPGALFLTGAVDVQSNRLEWAVFGWGVGLTCWVVDRGVIEGDPNQTKVWTDLDTVVAQRYEDMRGNLWPLDAVGIDSGYLSSRVYAFAAKYAGTNRVFALDGRPNWKLPPIGAPVARDIDFQGRKIGRALLWPVGTWDMKSEHYWALAQTLAGANTDTGLWHVGTLHLPDWVDKPWLEQLTAEHLQKSADKNGIVHLKWVKDANKPNEALDLAVYARALAHHLSDSLKPQEWAELAARRGEDPKEAQLDLARLWAPGLVEAKAAPEQLAAAVDVAAGVRSAAPPSRSMQSVSRPIRGSFQQR